MSGQFKLACLLAQENQVRELTGNVGSSWISSGKGAKSDLVDTDIST